MTGVGETGRLSAAPTPPPLPHHHHHGHGNGGGDRDPMIIPSASSVSSSSSSSATAAIAEHFHLPPDVRPSSSRSASGILAKKTAKDFIFQKVIGEGSFSMVFLAMELETKRELAVKVCEKDHIKRYRKIKAIMREKELMNLLNQNPSPFFVKLYCTFQDTDRLYFVMTYAKNGELLPYIKKVGSFDEECTRFYAGEIILALEHLHKLGIIHRDLKPENILLKEDMHILIADFGSATQIAEPKSDDLAAAAAGRRVGGISGSSSDGTSTPTNENGGARRSSFDGTAQYVSPEMLTDKRATLASDLWALGCIVYQMVAGLPPFHAPNEFLMFQKIVRLDFAYPNGFNELARDLVSRLLVLKHDERIGSSDPLHTPAASPEDHVGGGGYVSIKAHKFFAPLAGRWASLHTETPPRILPYLPSTGDNEELRSEFCALLNLEPGLDEKQISRLVGLELQDENYLLHNNKNSLPSSAASSHSPPADSLYYVPPEEKRRRLVDQERSHPYHKFVEGNLILKQGLIDKRRGLFARRRMLLLTTPDEAGPHLYYVDPVNMVLKGQIPFSHHLRTETKNFKTFFVHVPNRTYYLEDPASGSADWCLAINEVWQLYCEEQAWRKKSLSAPASKSPSNNASAAAATGPGGVLVSNNVLPNTANHFSHGQT